MNEKFVVCCLFIEFRDYFHHNSNEHQFPPKKSVKNTINNIYTIVVVTKQNSLIINFIRSKQIIKDRTWLETFGLAIDGSLKRDLLIRENPPESLTQRWIFLRLNDRIATIKLANVVVRVFFKTSFSFTPFQFGSEPTTIFYCSLFTMLINL